MGKCGVKWFFGGVLLRGVNTINLDAKGRMAMPSRYREQLQESCERQLVVTVDRERHLLLYPLPEWERVERKLLDLPTFDPKARRLQRLIMGHATDCEMDGSGRILLPSVLREFAAIEKKIVMIGQGNKFEIWDEGRWNALCASYLEEDDEENINLASWGGLSL